MKDIILETLLAEATKKVSKLVKKGKDRKDAVKEVAEDMDLTDVETDELETRIEAIPADEMPSLADLKPEANVINFTNPDEVEQASGILMYKSIPWRVKSVNPPFISFDTKDELVEAKDALKRRWDFLEGCNRTVGVVEFDNLDEFEKVLDFIRRSGFMTENTPSDDLAEDILDELAAPAEDKKPRRIKESDIVPKDHAYKAVPKNHSVVNDGTFDPQSRHNRSIKVRKKWK